MMKKLFKTTKIFLDSETVAEQLRQRRQEKKIKLEQAAVKLNINIRYLEALEKGQHDKSLQGVYGKNFLREYALFLGLNYQQLVKDYETEINVLDPKRQKEIFAKQIIKARYFWAAPKILKNILIGFVIVVCFVYLGYRVNKIISPPALTVTSPAANLITKEALLAVTGKTQAEAGLTINGETVLPAKSGNFSKIISLKKGINIIIVTAGKKYGRLSTVARQVLLKE